MINRLIATGCYAAALLIGISSAKSLEINNTGEAPAPGAAAATIPGLTSIGCREAAAMVLAAGFRNVTVWDCDGIQYRFDGEKGGVTQVVVFSAATGGMTALAK